MLKKIDSPREKYTSIPLVMLECCCLPGKLQKQGKFVASFVYKIDEISAIFSSLGAWRVVKTPTCLLRFSALSKEPRPLSLVHRSLLHDYCMITRFKLLKQVNRLLTDLS